MKFIIPIMLLFLSCEIPTGVISYDGDRLVVFCNINVNAIQMDPIYISKSSNSEFTGDIDELYITNAKIKLEEICLSPNCDSWEIFGCSNEDGDDECDGERPFYKFEDEPNIKPNTTYRLIVINTDENHNLLKDTVIAETTTPIDFSISSPSGIYQGYCDDDDIQDVISVDEIEVDNVDNTSLMPIPVIDNVSIITYNKMPCYTQGFWSAPYFYIDVMNDNGESFNFLEGETAIRTLTYALGTDSNGNIGTDPSIYLSPDNYLQKCNEPVVDANNDYLYTEGEELNFFDYNNDGQWNLTYSNAIYDTTTAYLLFFNDQIKRDFEGHPYLDNPFVWTAQNSPIPMVWLYFHYYGMQLIAVQMTDKAYVDYLSGLSTLNPFVLATSNFNEGYGLFSSTYSKYFYVFIDKPDDGMLYNVNCK